MKIVLASNNKGKLAELQALFGELGVELVPQAALGVPEAEEPFHTFLENALTKARNASRHSGLPAIADDAGLCVDAFGGQPGVQTAYYATQFGYPKGDGNNVIALLEQMQGITQRRAALVSTLVAVRSPDDPEPLVAVGRAVGQITQQPIGDNGFGFDPVMFIPELNQTFAQMDPDEKNRRSHRGQSAREMVRLLRNTWLAPDAA
ncbi:RdgB/HAM1 family non-canonical purine NTP pyrophosphatase [Brachymonas denitrificans]|uniref:RdgB/HAM1 family non-canonical purine NTP pyrophosphatase n=1 Tax=Brachymonas denitrificans TaxID=28220 RepID=UPI001BCED78C|nr:RdgB/HAM1 family non-canonical purine NTP pyrophosphatase [Brachymonas denitrificans]